MAPREVSQSALVSAASGAVSGSVVSACLQPLDVVRTRMQSDATLGASSSAMGAFRNVVGEGGVWNLWRGTSATVLRVGGGASVHFFSLSLLREMQDRAEDKEAASAMANALVGGLSRGLAATIMCPITTVKTRMESSGAAAAGYAYSSVWQALTHISRTEGAVALWRGLPPALLANVPFSALHYAFYRQLQTRLQVRYEGGLALNLASGAGASLAATLMTQPFDVIRTRTMLDMKGGRLVHGLMVGIGPRLMKRTLQTSLVWAMYEELWKWSHGRIERKTLRL